MNLNIREILFRINKSLLCMVQTKPTATTSKQMIFNLSSTLIVLSFSLASFWRSENNSTTVSGSARALPTGEPDFYFPDVDKAFLVVSFFVLDLCNSMAKLSHLVSRAYFFNTSALKAVVTFLQRGRATDRLNGSSSDYIETESVIGE